jgi:hypothetical protein
MGHNVNFDNNNNLIRECTPAMMAQWLERGARNQKVPGSTAMSSLGDWFTQP